MKEDSREGNEAYNCVLKCSHCVPVRVCAIPHYVLPLTLSHFLCFISHYALLHALHLFIRVTFHNLFHLFNLMCNMCSVL